MTRITSPAAEPSGRPDNPPSPPPESGICHDAFAQDELVTSALPTGQLLALALTLPVTTGNELYGRSHCWYAIAHTQADAIEFVIATMTGQVASFFADWDNPVTDTKGLVVSMTSQERRVMAARALAKGGYTLASVTALATR